MRKFWKIEGYERSAKIFDQEIPQSDMGEYEIKVLLARLVCAHLSAPAILAASLRRDDKRYRPELDVRINQKPERYGFACGSNPHYVATIVERE
jgi:hypothetical protein